MPQAHFGSKGHKDAGTGLPEGKLCNLYKAVTRDRRERLFQRLFHRLRGRGDGLGSKRDPALHRHEAMDHRRVIDVGDRYAGGFEFSA